VVRAFLKRVLVIALCSWGSFAAMVRYRAGSDAHRYSSS
jgi:hypothetical protein